MPVRGSSWPSTSAYSALRKLAGLIPRRLFEVCAFNVSHLQQIREMDVLGHHLSPHVQIGRLLAHQVHLGVAGVPCAGGQVGITLEHDARGARLARAYLGFLMEGSILRSARCDEIVGARRHVRVVAAARVERLAALGRSATAVVHRRQSERTTRRRPGAESGR